MTFLQQTRAAAAQTVLKALARRNMTGEYCPAAADALEAVKRFLIPGTSIGAMEAIRESGCTVLDRHAASSPEEEEEIYRRLLFCDTYFMSANAVTMDGVLVNIDGNANRVAALCFGPRKVVLVVGMNKVAADLESAVSRARNTAGPANATRLGLSTPCVSVGRCCNCQSEDCICCQVVITRRSRRPNRIHVILVGEDLGF